MGTVATIEINESELFNHRFTQRGTHPGHGYRCFKRGLDIVSAAAGLILCVPLLTAAMVWILCVDGRPVFYSQWRVGRNGWLFRLYKLRTMTCEAESDGKPRFAHSRDPRILPGCSWVRRSHVDELPQLWNILIGQMSLVGPRPERPGIIEQLRRSMPGFERRLMDKPGLTGLAQVRNGYTNDLPGARKKLAYDLRYLRERTVWREIKLVLATVPKIWDKTAL